MIQNFYKLFKIYWKYFENYTYGGREDEGE
jgi:hypothetical protein